VLQQCEDRKQSCCHLINQCTTSEKIDVELIPNPQKNSFRLMNHECEVEAVGTKHHNLTTMEIQNLQRSHNLSYFSQHKLIYSNTWMTKERTEMKR
jgi:hypothetical protein